MKDAVIVGAGLAGLAAAWRTRHWDTLVLEASSRVGGRIRSESRGPYFLNWGGHVFAGTGTSTDALLTETGARAVTVPGKLSALAMNGTLLTRGRIENYPFRIPMPATSRLALIRAGLKVGLGVLRYTRAVRHRSGEEPEARQQRAYGFENERSFAEYVGDLPEDAAAMFYPTVTRSSADPDQLAAGAGIGYFSLVWNIGPGLNRSILGGPSTLTDTIAAALSERITLGADVVEVVHQKDSVLVRYTHDGVEQEAEARTVILATPAMVTHRVGVDLPAEVREALSRIVYGPYVSAAFLTNETTPQRWDAAYAIATPKRSFNVALNMGNVSRAVDTRRQPGGSIMAFSPGSLARRLLDRSDEEIAATYTQDLDQALPGSGDLIEEAHIQRWPTGAPYSFPGRGALQPVLTRPRGQSQRVFLAGDYLGTLYTETAIQTGFAAARDAISALGTKRQSRHATQHPPPATPVYVIPVHVIPVHVIPVNASTRPQRRHHT